MMGSAALYFDFAQLVDFAKTFLRANDSQFHYFDACPLVLRRLSISLSSWHRPNVEAYAAIDSPRELKGVGEWQEQEDRYVSIRRDWADQPVW